MKKVTYYESKVWDLLCDHNTYASFFLWCNKDRSASELTKYLTTQAEHWFEELDEMEDLINTAINELLC